MQFGGLGDDFSDIIDSYETGSSQAADAASQILGNDTTDTSYYDGEYQSAAAVSQSEAIAAVQSAAASGNPVPASAVDTLQSQGISLSQIATGAGAIFKLIAGANGSYTAQPVNAQAQAVVAQRQSTTKLFFIGGAALLAFALLKG